MAILQIRDLPDDLYAELRREAARYCPGGMTAAPCHTGVDALRNALILKENNDVVMTS